MVSFPDAVVASNYCLDTHSSDIKFKRTFSSENMRSLEQMMGILVHIFLSDQLDTVKWAFEKKGEYTTR